MTPALFLDRDGVINMRRDGYVNALEDFEFVPAIFPVCRRAAALGMRIVVVTNQAGISLGKLSPEVYQQITEHMVSQFRRRAITIDRVYHCPDYDPVMRKPGPGMIIKAQRELGLDLRRSLLIGDQDTDVQAGERAGVRSNLLIESDGIADILPQLPGILRRALSL